MTGLEVSTIHFCFAGRLAGKQKPRVSPFTSFKVSFGSELIKYAVQRELSSNPDETVAEKLAGYADKLNRGEVKLAGIPDIVKRRGFVLELGEGFVTNNILFRFSDDTTVYRFYSVIRLKDNRQIIASVEEKEGSQCIFRMEHTHHWEDKHYHFVEYADSINALGKNRPRSSTDKNLMQAHQFFEKLTREIEKAMQEKTESVPDSTYLHKRLQILDPDMADRFDALENACLELFRIELAWLQDYRASEPEAYRQEQRSLAEYYRAKFFLNGENRTRKTILDQSI